jgi:hypothetical protein
MPHYELARRVRLAGERTAFGVAHALLWVGHDFNT